MSELTAIASSGMTGADGAMKRSSRKSSAVAGIGGALAQAANSSVLSTTAAVFIGRPLVEPPTA
jgi:hypothetical protein